MRGRVCVRLWEAQELEEGRGAATATKVFAEILDSELMLTAAQNVGYNTPSAYIFNLQLYLALKEEVGMLKCSLQTHTDG